MEISDKTIIELTDVNFAYKKNSHRQIVSNVSLTIDRGTSIALLGTSGSGKSTLLSLMGLLNHPDSGTITLCSKDVKAFSEKERDVIRANQIGFIFQHHFLLPDLTATENVKLAAMVAAEHCNEGSGSEGRGEKSEKSMEERAIEILTDLGLKERLNAFPKELSGGEQQRVAIARAIINNPSLILADEPTGNLDSESGQNVLSCLSHLKQHNDCALVIATHNKEVANSCNRQIIIKDGKLELTTIEMKN
jgi:ABC-type lipoprotein export system ATPase subunit